MEKHFPHSDNVNTDIFYDGKFFDVKIDSGRERLLKEVIRVVASSEDLEVIKYEIVKLVSIAFKSDRCFIRIFDDINNKFQCVDTEYRSSETIKSVIGVKFPEALDQQIAKAYNAGSCFYLPDINVFINNLTEEQFIIGKILKDLDVKSYYCCPISQENKLIGTFVLHYTNDEVLLDDAEFDLLKIIAKQIVSAINNAAYLEHLKKQAEREKLQREIISAIRNNLDLNTIKQTFVTELGKALNIDRVAFIEYNKATDKFIPLDEYSEFRLSDDVKSMKDFNVEDYEFFKNAFRNGEEVIIKNLDDFLETYKPNDSSAKDYIEKYSIRSGFGVPISYKNEIFGRVFAHFTHEEVPLKDEDIDFIRSLTYQAGIAIKQSELFFETKRIAEKRRLSNNIMNAIRSSLNISKLKKIIVTEVGKAFDVDRCAIAEYDSMNHSAFEVPKYAEYIKDDTVKSFVGFDWKSAKLPFSTKLLADQRKILEFSDLDKFIVQNNLCDEEADFYKNFDIKSSYNFPIVYSNELRGGIFIDYTKAKVELNEDDIKFLKELTDHIAIALYQVELFTTTQQQAQDAELVKNVIQTIAGTLDLDNILNKVGNEILKSFDVDRVSFGKIDNQSKTWKVLVALKKYPSAKEHTNTDHSYAIDEYFNELIINRNEDLIINNVNDSKIPDFYKEYLLDFDIKSTMLIPVKKGNDKWGIMTIHKNTYRDWTESEINLLHTIMEQLYIGIRQAELHTKTKRQAEKEELLRKITQNIMSSLDLDIVKNSIIRELGQVLDADRCIITEIDPNNTFSPFSFEYLSSSNIASIRDKDMEDLSEDFLNIFNKSRILKFNSIDDIEKEPFLDKEEFYKRWKTLSIKSAFSVPIMHYNHLIGILTVQHVQKAVEYTDEQISFVRDLADQVGVAIAHARLYETEKKHAMISNSEIKVMSAIKSSMSIQECLYVICSEIAAILNVEQVTVDYYDDKSKVIKTIKPYKNVDYKLSEDAKDYLLEKVQQEGNNIIINDLSVDNSPLRTTYGDHYGSLLIIPIRNGMEKFGALTVLDTKTKRWTKEDIGFLVKNADYVSIAIKNANLYTQAQFISNVSHELKTPIATINGYAEAILFNDPNKSLITEKFIKIIKRNTDRLNNIINDLLYISSIERTTQTSSFTCNDIDMSELIIDAIHEMKEFCDFKNINILFTPVKNIKLYANSQLIKQVMTNLISNAIKYSNNGTQITINLNKTGTNTVIKVKDQGIGIKNQDLFNIFEPFYRADKSRSRETGGTGLGLSIVKSIVEAHNGRITVESDFGKGSCFTVSFLNPKI